jgi:hypothetical protein
VCTPGATQACYSGPMGTLDVGQCKGGTQTCASDGMSWGACVGEVLPGAETCGNMTDEDCNGSVASGSVCLVSANLVVRYFLDEAATGPGVTAVDSAPNPLNLPVTFASGQPNYTSVATGRGLEWTTGESNGFAGIAVDGTKVKMMLDGKQKGTIEVVARVNGTTGQIGRLVAIGTDSTSMLTLGTTSTNRLISRWNNSAGTVEWNANFGAIQRAVIHLVVDTTAMNSADRTRLYVDGVLQTASGGTQPPQDNTMNMGTGRWICLGNRETQGRSLDGILYYAAVYANALSTMDIAANVAILKAGDDK